MPLSRRRLLVTTAGLATAPAIGWAQSKPNGQVVIGLSQEPTVFDPRRPHIEVDDGVHLALYSPLWAVAPERRDDPAPRGSKCRRSPMAACRPTG